MEEKGIYNRCHKILNHNLINLKYLQNHLQLLNNIRNHNNKQISTCYHKLKLFQNKQISTCYLKLKLFHKIIQYNKRKIYS